MATKSKKTVKATKIPYGGNNGTGEAKPGKRKTPIRIQFNDTTGGRGSYQVDCGKHRTNLTRLLRVLGAVGYKVKEADQFLADHGCPNLSLNTLRSQLHSAYRGTIPAAKRKATSISKSSNALHHGVAEPEDLKGYACVKSALAYYKKRIEAVRAISGRAK